MNDTYNIARLRTFVTELADLMDIHQDEPALLAAAAPLLGQLVAHDDWLPAQFSAPGSRDYQQYLLHCDSRQRFSIVSFVWAPGQSTPIHNHQTWGLIGMLRGCEVNQSYVIDEAGIPRPKGAPERLTPGNVEMLSPTTGDIHKVWNYYEDRPSVSVHVYGANIGAVKRLSYDAEGGSKTFISGYSNATLPNLWDLSKEEM
ncbi:cysteine dioxygenase family protein [Sphingobium mellinum]|uniref:cysteine dioxygenase family protein n=1 Tax=Sphingobium mellinum TaxID=1387166 RepID=UPI0030EF2646